MNDAEALSAVESLFFRWQAHRAAGKPVAPPDLCRDRPDLLAPLERRIADEYPDDADATGEYATRKAPPRADIELDSAAHEAVLEFDLAWQSGNAPNLTSFLPPDGPQRAPVALGLALIDVERRRAAGLPVSVENYLDLVPELGRSPDAVARLRHAVDPPAPEPEPAASGRYEIAAEHARGGMGRVCVAIDTELNRRVAFKDIQERFADDAATRHRFTREALITGQLEHPGVIPVYGLGADAHGRPYYAMRFVEGDSLKDAVKEFHRDPPKCDSVGAKAVAFRALLKRFADVCNAVAFAHSKRIVHRDLKPANVMLGQFGETLVVDWGLARSFADKTPELTASPREAGAGEQDTADMASTAVSGGDSAGTRTGQVMGSPAYMSPEQATGDLRSLGPAWDIYSLGATLYELLTGRPPFIGQPVPQLLKAIQAGELVPPREVAPWVPKPLDAIARKAMSRDPKDRYPTALELAAEVDRYLADEPVQAHRDTLGERVRRWRKRHPVLVRTAVMLFLIVTPLLAVWLVIALEINRLRLGALKREEKAHDQTRGALEAEKKALAAEQAALKQVRATLDLTTDAVVGKILAKQSRLGPDEREFLEGLVASYAKFAEASGDSPEAQLLAARARLRVALIRERLGDSVGAAREYKAAVDVLRALKPPDATDAASVRDLGAALLGYATAVRDTDTRAAIAAVQEAIRVHETSVKSEPQNLANPQNRERWKNFGHALTQAADLLLYGNQRAQAEQLYRKYITEYQPVVLTGLFGADGFETLAKTYDHLARLEGLKKQYKESEKTLNDAITLFAALEKRFPDEPRYRHQRAYAQTTRAQLLLRAGKSAEARQVVAPLVEAYRDLAHQFPGVREFRHGLATALDAQVGVSEATGDRAEAIGAMEDRRAVLTRLVAEYPEFDDDRFDLITLLRSLEKEYAKDGRKADAKQAKDQADRLRRAAPKK